MIRKWLLSVIVLILLMVSVGGITRLTGSGLSITEWKPIMGVVPPLNETAWTEAFRKYQVIPQFQQINSAMTLHGFKWIFFWEYSHRLLGRMIGLVFGLPFLFFFLRGMIARKWLWPLAGVFGLGGLQGALGWFMVKSGLADLTYVSHYRLAAHLLLALLIASAIVWILKRMKDDEASPASVRLVDCRLACSARILGAGVLVQTIYGAFTAGLKAGFQFPTFPTMGGQWIPAGFLERSPVWRNFFENPASVQWVHRVLGTLLLVSFLFIWVRSRSRLEAKSQRRALTLAAHLVLVQYILGACVVFFGVPVWLGTLHQLTGSLVFLAVVNLIYEFPRTPSSPMVPAS